ncbi:hypothetical protein BIY21_14495 [Vibrio ponticus]|uniref:Uncharacterized protein n=1 Tax=Vibrio ponticus TaxID=265668 RepID=A0ABX3FD15_9VIBR|nr:hypothetical protein BIY21_14495 [Vibrio ponticus]
MINNVVIDDFKNVMQARYLERNQSYAAEKMRDCEVIDIKKATRGRFLESLVKRQVIEIIELQR